MKEVPILIFNYNHGVEIFGFKSMLKAKIAYFIVANIFNRNAFLCTVEMPEDKTKDYKKMQKYFVENMDKL